MPKSGPSGMCYFNKYPGKPHASAVLLCKKAKPTPKPKPTNHEKTGLGPKKCNNGDLTGNQCKTATAQEGMAFMRVAGWNSYPGGCFCMPKSGPSGMCYFNKYPGKPHASAVLLCKKAKPTP